MVDRGIVGREMGSKIEGGVRFRGDECASRRVELCAVCVHAAEHVRTGSGVGAAADQFLRELVGSDSYAAPAVFRVVRNEDPRCVVCV